MYSVKEIRVALLHLAPEPGRLDYNRRLIERGITLAAQNGARFIITPELAVSGYRFERAIGTNWIEGQPGTWTSSIMELAKKHAVNIFLSQPEAFQAHFYNSVFAIDATGNLKGVYRKTRINPKITSENWSSPGTGMQVIELEGVKFGVLICCDSYTPDLAAQYKALGSSEILVAPSAWPPLPCSPEGCWEKRSVETGLPVWVPTVPDARGTWILPRRRVF